MKFRISYIESGDGKMIGGRCYDGKRTVVINGRNAAHAERNLRNRYSEGAIKEVTTVDPVSPRVVILPLDSTEEAHFIQDINDAKERGDLTAAEAGTLIDREYELLAEAKVA